MISRFNDFGIIHKAIIRGKIVDKAAEQNLSDIIAFAYFKDIIEFGQAVSDLATNGINVTPLVIKNDSHDPFSNTIITILFHDENDINHAKLVSSLDINFV